MTAASPGPDFYDRDSREVAQELLGYTLVSESSEGTTAGVIVETEAYRPDDPACHAYENRGTLRNRSIFGPPGTAYVYLSYGIHNLLNLVCEPQGVGSAVLVRALRPVEGLDLMRARRGRDDLCAGPGKLSQALGLDLSYDGHDMSRAPLYIVPADEDVGEIISTTRIGISRGKELPWRFLVDGDPNISVKPGRASASRSR